jgi:predicted  nucleic acid-binding Zn-ribbon protein
MMDELREELHKKSEEITDLSERYISLEDQLVQAKGECDKRD